MWDYEIWNTCVLRKGVYGCALLRRRTKFLDMADNVLFAIKTVLRPFEVLCSNSAQEHFATERREIEKHKAYHGSVRLLYDGHSQNSTFFFTCIVFDDAISYSVACDCHLLHYQGLYTIHWPISYVQNKA